MQETCDQIVNLLVIGNANVGKTNFVQRYTHNQFSEGSPSTIGLDYQFKEYHYDGHKINVKFWDTAGQEKY